MQQILIIEYYYKKKEHTINYDMRLFDDKKTDPDDLITAIKMGYKQEKKEGRPERVVNYSNTYTFEECVSYIRSANVPQEHKSFLLDQLCNILKSTWRDSTIYN